MDQGEGLQAARQCLSEATAHLERDDVQGAHASFRRAVELLNQYGTAEERVRVHREWVEALRARGQEELALEAFRLASELAPRQYPNQQ